MKLTRLLNIMKIELSRLATDNLRLRVYYPHAARLYELSRDVVCELDGDMI